MRPLTLHGFLKQYLRQLSGLETLSMARLAEEMAHNPRLREPLFLYALFTDNVDYLLQGVNSEDYRALASRYDRDSLYAAMESPSSSLPEEYKKLYRSYRAVATRKQSDDHTKMLILNRIRNLQVEQGVSNYRLYKDLSLNPGNVNAYLRHGDTSKVSLDVARSLLKRLEQ